MPDHDPGFDLAAHARAACGLAVVGTLVPAPDDPVPAGTARLALLGAVDGAMWDHFAASPEASDAKPDPLDRWTARVVTDLAEAAGGTALFPFGGPPWMPFIRWARDGEGATGSPVGLLVSPGRGLWASWRAAIALKREHDAPIRTAAASPCLDCHAPCLTACPVGALSAAGYDPDRCAAHAGSAAGTECRDGCLVRAACPASAGLPLPRAQRRFHMDAFLRTRIAGG